MTNSPARDSDLPAYVQKAWKIAQNPDENRQSSRLNASKIVNAAIGIADERGLEAVTIRAIAQKVGFTTMAVYRHIESRDELLLLMFEVAMGTAPAFDADDWRENVREWSRQLLGRYKQHPWALELKIIGVPATPNHMLWVERALQILNRDGLSLQTRLDIALLLDGHVQQFAKIQGAAKSLVPQSVVGLRQLEELAGAETPNLISAIRSGSLEDEGGVDFIFGIDLIIKGIEAGKK